MHTSLSCTCTLSLFFPLLSLISSHFVAVLVVADEEKVSWDVDDTLEWVSGGEIGSLEWPEVGPT